MPNDTKVINVKNLKKNEYEITVKLINVMDESEITKYFGETINTIFGRCFVEGFSDDKTSIILYEHGEPFTYSIEDFLSEIREHN